MITPIYSAVQVTAENIKFFKSPDYNPVDFVDLYWDSIKIDDVVVTMTLNIKDPIDDQFGIRRQSHWVISEEVFNKKFSVNPDPDYTDLKKFVLITPK